MCHLLKGCPRVAQDPLVGIRFSVPHKRDRNARNAREQG